MSVEKKIVVTAALDPSFEKVKSAIQQLVSEVTRLGEAFNRVNQGFGGQAGGGGFKLDAKSGIASAPGGSPLGAAVHRATASVGGNGVADNLARSVQNMSQLFKVASEQGTGAMKVMSDMLRRNVEESDRNIERLSRSLSKLTAHYEKLHSMKGRGAIVDTAINEVQERYSQQAGQLSAARAHRAQLDQLGLQATGYGDVPEYAGYEVGRPWGARLRSFFGGESGVGGVRGAINGVAQRGLGMLGIGAAGGVAGVIGAGLAGYQFGASAINSYQLANLGAGIEMPLWNVQREARLGQIFGGNAQNIRSGDYARAFMLNKLQGEAGYKQIASDRYAQLVEANAKISTPETLREAMSAGRTIEYGKGLLGSSRYGVASLFNAANDTVARALGSPTGGGSDVLGEMEGMPNQTPMQIARRKAMLAASTQTAEIQQKYLEEALQRDPMLMGLINKVGNGALGQLSLARAAGISGGISRLPGSKFGADSLGLLRSNAYNAGYDESEWVGMMQQIAGTAGRGLMHRRTNQMLSMQHGGLQNAVQLYSLGSQYMGGGDAGGGALIDAIQGITGRGGLDPLAASQLTGAASGMVMDPRFMGSNPDDFFKVIGRASATGSPGQDLRMARYVTGGLGVYGNVLGGQIDPLQQALNASAAIGAAPNSGYYAHQGLMGLDVASMISGLRGGEGGLPDWMRMRGISHGMLKDYSKNMMGTMFSRLVGPEAAGTEMGAAAGRYMEAGGLGYMKGMKGGERSLEMKRLAEGLSASMGISRGDALGFISVLAAQEGVGGDELSGRGAHQSATKYSLHADAARSKADMEKDEAVRFADHQMELYTALKSALPAQKAEEMMRKLTQQVGRRDSTEGALEDVQAALQRFVTALRQEMSGRGSVGVVGARAPGGKK